MPSWIEGFDWDRLEEIVFPVKTSESRGLTGIDWRRSGRRI